MQYSLSCRGRSHRPTIMPLSSRHVVAARPHRHECHGTSVEQDPPSLPKTHAAQNSRQSHHKFVHAVPAICRGRSVLYCMLQSRRMPLRAPGISRAFQNSCQQCHSMHSSRLSCNPADRFASVVAYAVEDSGRRNRFVLASSNTAESRVQPSPRVSPCDVGLPWRQLLAG